MIQAGDYQGALPLLQQVAATGDEEAMKAYSSAKKALAAIEEQVRAGKLDDLIAHGGRLVAMEGGFNPRLKLDHYEAMFRAVEHEHAEAGHQRVRTAGAVHAGRAPARRADEIDLGHQRAA